MLGTSSIVAWLYHRGTQRSTEVHRENLSVSEKITSPEVSGQVVKFCVGRKVGKGLLNYE